MQKSTIISFLVSIVLMVFGYGIFIMYSEHSSKPSLQPIELMDTFAQPLGFVQSSKPVRLKNNESYTLTAQMVQQEMDGKIVPRLAYNGQIPGPRFIVEQGSTVFITLQNNTNIPTTLHPHGLRLDDAYDGVPKEMMGMQDPIMPGKSFTYTLTFPDAGAYWYHPHIREDYTQEMGMYGMFFVEPSEKNYWNRVDTEYFLILDDFLSDAPFYKNITTHALMGRYGNSILVNNEKTPIFHAQRGEKVRFYFLNTANARPFDIVIDGGQMVKVGGDVGRVEKEQRIKNIILGPAERSIVEIQFEDDGTYSILHKNTVIAQVQVASVDKHSVETPILRSSANDYADIRKDMNMWLQKPADKTLSLTMQMQGMGNMDHSGHSMGSIVHDLSTDGIEWEDTMPMMNSMSTEQNMTWILKDTQTGKENMDILWKFKKGELVKISIFNDPNSMHPMQHPIHFHGQRFAVLSIDGVPNENLQWKDTTMIASGRTVDILLDASNEGNWMAHCHIAEHLSASMMLHFTVMD